MNTKIIYCNNCGNEGHLYRHCRLPVLSYGILCINKDKLFQLGWTATLGLINKVETLEEENAKLKNDIELIKQHLNLT